MADERGNVLEPKHLSKQTLFPVLGASGASGSLLFPCASVKVEERAADFGKGKRKLPRFDTLD